MRPPFWLLISGVDPKVWSFRWNGDPLMVGRHKSCDIKIPNENVSRFHARIECKLGRLHITDMDSTNGTYLNGERIGECEFRVGDTLLIGGTRLMVAKGTEKAPEPEFDPDEPTPMIRDGDRTIVQSENGPLTERQTQVLRLLGEGLSQKQIAARLDIGESTVHTHVQRIHAAFGVHSQGELLARLRGHDHGQRSKPDPAG